jgi:hypothetical protein
MKLLAPQNTQNNRLLVILIGGVMTIIYPSILAIEKFYIFLLLTLFQLTLLTGLFFYPMISLSMHLVLLMTLTLITLKKSL